MKWLFKDKSLDSAERLELTLSYFLQAIILATTIYYLLQQRWLQSFLLLGILILTLLPSIVRRNYRVHLPVEIDMIVIMFIFSSLFLGEIHAYYTKFWWWDIILHISSSFLIGMAGFILVYVLNEEKKISLKMKPGFVALFAFAFAMMIGSFWEIIEFSIDSFLALNMQKSGLTDTMWDLIVNALGALIVALLGYGYLKSRWKSVVFERIIGKFVEMNPRLFRKDGLGNKRQLHNKIKS